MHILAFETSSPRGTIARWNDCGQGRMEDIQLLVDVANKIEGHTICALGDAAAWPIQSFVKHFRHEFEYMVQHGWRSLVDGQTQAA